MIFESFKERSFMFQNDHDPFTRIELFLFRLTLFVVFVVTLGSFLWQQIAPPLRWLAQQLEFIG